MHCCRSIIYARHVIIHRCAMDVRLQLCFVVMANTYKSLSVILICNLYSFKSNLLTFFLRRNSLFSTIWIFKEMFDANSLLFANPFFFLLKIKVTFQVSYYWLEAKINVFSFAHGRPRRATFCRRPYVLTNFMSWPVYRITFIMLLYNPQHVLDLLNEIIYTKERFSNILWCFKALGRKTIF